MARSSIRAVSLLSGGLDSALAAKIVMDEGIDLRAVHFVVPFAAGFCKPGRLPAERVAEALGLDLAVVTLGEEYLEIVRAPRYGYGKNVNPCIDCRIFMLTKARRIMSSLNAEFIVTGEVLGQRPMSQRRDVMRKVEAESGLEGRLLRPLSAKILAETLAERKGWVNRERLGAMSGRSRKETLRLAAAMGLQGYTTPGGGCLLTDPLIARRVRDLLGRGALDLRHIRTLTVGRHFRLPLGSKLIVGRNEADNIALAAAAASGDTLLRAHTRPGPTAILETSGPDEDDLAAAIVARYSDTEPGVPIGIEISSGSGRSVTEVVACDADVPRRLMI